MFCRFLYFKRFVVQIGISSKTKKTLDNQKKKTIFDCTIT